MSSPVEKHHPSSPDFYQYRAQLVSVAPMNNSRHTVGSERPELRQQESNDSDFKQGSLTDEEGKEGKEDELDLLPGSGPGGVPQKYFNVS